jgi:DHA2 family methylenomycin A resistance protein-like MFS transporter
VARSSARLIGSIALGNALVPLNSTLIVVALPAISRDVHADLASASWLLTTYLIAMAALQPVGGHLGDRFGRRQLMLGALAYFGLASVGAGLSDGLVVLVFFRVQQAVAGAMIVPNGLAILRQAAGDRAGTHFGIIGAVTNVAASVGPLIGGLLVPIDWRLIFTVNIPIVAIAFILGWSSLRHEEVRAHTTLDMPGTVALGLLLSGVAWVLTNFARGSPDAPTLALGAVVIAGAVVFVRYENALEDPALPPSLFRVRAFSAATGAMCFATVALYGTILGIPVLLADAESTTLIGVALFALAAMGIVLGPIAGILIDRLGARWPSVLGGLLILVGALASGAVITSERLSVLLPSLLVLGAGVAFAFPAARVAAIDTVAPGRAAFASGVVSTSRYFGGMLGAIIASATLTAFAPASRGPILFAIISATGLLTAVASLGMPRLSSSDPRGTRIVSRAAPS